MGFDDGECYLCYALGHGNNHGDRHNVCFVCFGEKVEERDPERVNIGIGSCLGRSIAENCLTNGKCYLCGKRRNMLMTLSLCDGHFDDQ